MYHRQLTSFLVWDKELTHPTSSNHGCWFSGDTGSQGIGKYDIYNVELEWFAHGTLMLNTGSLTKIFKPVFWLSQSPSLKMAPQLVSMIWIALNKNIANSAAFLIIFPIVDATIDILHNITICHMIATLYTMKKNNRWKVKVIKEWVGWIKCLG